MSISDTTVGHKFPEFIVGTEIICEPYSGKTHEIIHTDYPCSIINKHVFLQLII